MKSLNLINKLKLNCFFPISPTELIFLKQVGFNVNDFNNHIHQLKETFIEETSFMLDELEESLFSIRKSENILNEIRKIFRIFHTIKGSGGAIGLINISEFSHLFEDCLSIIIEKPEEYNENMFQLLSDSLELIKKYIEFLKINEESSWNYDEIKNKILLFKGNLKLENKNEKENIENNKAFENNNFLLNNNKIIKVEAIKLDSIFDLISEMLILRSQILDKFIPKSQKNAQEITLLNLFDKISKELQVKTLEIRITPIKPIFAKMHRTIKDLSLKLNKPIEVEVYGEEIELDRFIIEQISDPLLHMVRNSMDHGIETQEEREINDKNKIGKITLSAQKLVGKIIISIKDDGKGININEIIKKAKVKKIIPDNYEFENQEKSAIYDILFYPGFSTAEKITDISGRGIGLDVVKSNINKLNGRIDISSEEKIGTEFKIILPSTTSIVNGFIAEFCSHKIIIPLENISTIISTYEIKRENRFIYFDNRTFPLFDLNEILHNRNSNSLSENHNSKKIIILLSVIGHEFCICIDKIEDQNQVVVKPLGRIFEKYKGINGFSILGNGKIAMVLDVEEIYNIVEEKLKFSNQQKGYERIIND